MLKKIIEKIKSFYESEFEGAISFEIPVETLLLIVGILIFIVWRILS